MYMQLIVFTQGPGGGRVGGNVGGGNGIGGTGNIGITSGNIPDKSRTSQTNSGDMSSSNRPGWFGYHPSSSCIKLTTNLSDIAILSICILTVLLTSL